MDSHLTILALESENDLGWIALHYCNKKRTQQKLVRVDEEQLPLMASIEQH